MSFYSDASLVLVPSGYKSGKAYSIKPTDGSGDLTFTRTGDTATRVNSDGLIEKVRTNYSLYSENQTQWVYQNETSVTYDTAANPLNGAVTADKVIPSTLTADHYRGFTMATLNGEVTASIYVKADGYNVIDWGIYNNTGTAYLVRATFDLSTQSISYYTGSIASITSIGSGWYRISVTGTLSSSSSLGVYHRVRPTVGTGNYAGDGTSGALFWGAQLENGVMTDYIGPTTSAAVSVGAGKANTPRIDYTGNASGCGRLLLEPQRTQLLYDSTPRNFTTGNPSNRWVMGANNPAVVNQAVGIFGYNSATKYTKTAGATTADFLYYSQATVVSGSVYTVSGYVKLGTASNAVFVLNDSLAWNTVTGGTFVATAAGGYNEWKRFSITFTAPASNKINLHIGYHSEVGLEAQATGTFFVEGLQLELGSYETSLIPSNGAAVTRGADAAYKTGISSLIGQTEGTIFWDFNVLPSTLAGSYYLQVNVNDGTISNQVSASYYSDGRLQFVAFVGGSLVVNINLPSYGLTVGKHKFAFAYKLNDYVAYVDGVSVGTDTSAGVGAMSKLDLYDTSGGTNAVNQALLFKTRLTNAQLAELTTL